MPNFRFIDLFAGIGGFHQAMTQLGGECVMACEIDAAARKIYELNYLTNNQVDFRFSKDITEFNEETASEVPDHDVLCAGFPCQPFSKSGKQLGINEARGTLFYNILAIIEAKKPAMIVLENVRNLAGPRHIETLDTIRRLLKGLGYYLPESPLILSPHKLPSPYGAPQHRERVYILAVRYSSDWDTGDNVRDIADVLRPMHSPSWSVSDFCDPKESSPKLPQTVERAIETWGTFANVLKDKSVKVPSFPLWSESWGQQQTSDDLPGWKRKILDKNQQFYLEHKRIIDEWLGCENYLSMTPTQRKLEWQCGDHWDIWNALIQIRPSGIRVKRMTHFPAMVAINQRSILGNPYRRYISVNEGLKLQGFDASFTFAGQSDDASFKQLGNAVNVGAVKFVVLLSQMLWGERFPSDALQLDLYENPMINMAWVKQRVDQPKLFQ